MPTNLIPLIMGTSPVVVNAAHRAWPAPRFNGPARPARRVRAAMAVTAILRSMSAKTIEVDAYVFDTLMRDLIAHDHFSSAFVTYLLLWRKSLGAGEPSVRISLRDIAEGTGLS